MIKLNRLAGNLFLKPQARSVSVGNIEQLLEIRQNSDLFTSPGRGPGPEQRKPKINKESDRSFKPEGRQEIISQSSLESPVTSFEITKISKSPPTHHLVVVTLDYDMGDVDFPFTAEPCQICFLEMREQSFEQSREGFYFYLPLLMHLLYRR
jgi:hypothetical protein